jgi:hypothetical protein
MLRFVAQQIPWRERAALDPLLDFLRRVCEHAPEGRRAARKRLAGALAGLLLRRPTSAETFHSPKERTACLTLLRRREVPPLLLYCLLLSFCGLSCVDWVCVRVFFFYKRVCIMPLAFVLASKNSWRACAS